MHHSILSSRAKTIPVALLLLLLSSGSQLKAQAVSETLAAKPKGIEEISQVDLLQSYLRVREQLHTAEMAIVNNRLESEAMARAQAAAISEKLDAIRSTLATEHEQQQAEAQRSAIERERQKIATEGSNRIILWIAAAFGFTGLLTMLATTLLQWRGIKRMTAVTNRQLTAAAAQPNWTASDHHLPSSESASHSSQRLISVIDRLERRILELEHTATPPVSVRAAAAPAETPSEPAAIRIPTDASADQVARIAALLHTGRSLLSSSKSEEAVACYDEILAIDPNHPEALVKKGSALERLKRDHEAIECYDRAIKADRNMALAYLSKGGVFNRLQRFDEAVECYEKALQVERDVKGSSVARVSVSGEWPASGTTAPA